MRKNFIYIISILFLSLRLSAQHPKVYSFAHHGTSEGLSSNEVFAIAQDEKGYIWIGTNNGLQRFDGKRYTTFRHQADDKASIPNNLILQLLVDRKKNLWLVTGDGKLGKFDTRRLTYTEVTVKVKNEAMRGYERRLIEDLDGNLLFLFFNHTLLTWNESKKEFSEEHNFIPFPAGWKFIDVVQQPGTRKYWIGRREGLAVYNLDSKQFSFAGQNLEKEAVIDSFGRVPAPGHIFFDQQGRLWFDAWTAAPAIYAFDLKQKRKVLDDYNFGFLQMYHEIRGVLQQKDGSIWVKGLAVFAKFLEKEKQFQPVYNGYRNEQSIDYDRINELIEDAEDNIWVATSNNGLYHFNPAAQFFTNVRHINRTTGRPGDGSVMSFLWTKQGSLLVGAWGEGLFHFDSNYNMIPINIRGFDEKVSPWAWSMCYSTDSNTAWMGSQPGVFEINMKTRSAVYHNPAIMQDRTVRQVGADRFGNLWMGTQSLGLFKWERSKGQKSFEEGVSQFKDIPISQILKISIDRRGYVWVGTSGFGLYMIDPVTSKVVLHFGKNEVSQRKLFGDGVVAAIDYDDSTIVIGASGIQLFNTRQQKIVKSIALPESLAGYMSAVEKDKDGYLWVSLSNGIYRVNPKNEIFVHFDRVDGIANDHFTIAASYVLPNGKILFGADNQFVAFDPLAVRINKPSPDIVLTGFKVMNQSLPVDSLQDLKRVELEPEDHSLTIEFSGLRYNGTYNIQYKLEKLEMEWKNADQSNQAVYSYLPPGTYTFMARSNDAEGNPSKNITKLVIRVKPPFWKTWWFLGFAIFAAMGVLYWLDKLRMQKIRATESLRSRIATSLSEDLSNSLTSINISSELAKSKVQTDAERTKEYISHISETSNRITRAMNDMVWSINPENDSMQHTIARMKSYAKEIETTHTISVVFEIEATVPELDLDMQHRYEILSIFKEALLNTARHSKGKHVYVGIKCKKQKLVVKIQDDGKGFDLDAAGLGRGINEMKRRASAINARLNIYSEINTGTLVRVELSL